MPKIVVGADDFPGGHDGGGDICHVTFQPDELPGTRYRGFVQARFPPAVLTNRGGRADFCPSITMRARFS